MSRLLRATALLFMVAACGSGNHTAPRNLDDACSIVAQRPEYLKAMQRVERRWGVPVSVQMATIYQESKFIGNARTPQKFALGIIPMGRQSSAYGYSQALDGTWDDYRKSTGQRLARRDDIRDATDFMGWYMDGTEKKLGIAKTNAAEQYFAYHEGRTGYSRGSHRQKAWLVDVAKQLDDRALIYQIQLTTCS